MAEHAVDRHPQKDFIVEQLLAGMPITHLAAIIQPPIAVGTLQHYRNAVRGIKFVEKTAPAASTFRDRLEQVYLRIDRHMDRAERAQRVVADPDTGELMPVGEDLKVMAPLINQAHKNIEMLGRATGELEPAQSNSIAIQIVLPTGGTGVPRIAYNAPPTGGRVGDEDVLTIEGEYESVGVIQAP